MLFSGITFLYAFLPVTLAAYFAVPKKAKNYVLLIASLIFYFFGEPVYTLLLVFSSISDYLHSLYIEKHRGEKRAKIALISSIAINLAMLGFFKYVDFFIGIVNGLFGAEIPLLNVPLPIGISFFTFQTMSYTIDVYRGKAKCERNFFTLATFVCLFPQLVAGPIVRYTDIAAELSERESKLQDVAVGIRRFIVGLGKKVLIANAMGELCGIFRDSPEKSVLFYWIYAIAYTLQIYFDFSGYSDMAIGLGRIFGFRFPENFNYPYISRSITEFWRRWHMTMGGWFRDYVYIPLGGNRVSKGKWFFNIFVVWFLTGFWHGADWTFIAWGLLFGILLVIEKLFLLKYLDRSKVISRIYVLLFVVIGFVIFNADGIKGAAADIGGMFGAGGLPLVSGHTLYYLRSYGLLIAAAIFGSMPVLRRLHEKLEQKKIMAGIEPIALCAILVTATAYLVDGSFNPFLYFRF